jgi:hypothetical protein
LRGREVGERLTHLAGGEGALQDGGGVELWDVELAVAVDQLGIDPAVAQVGGEAQEGVGELKVQLGEIARRPRQGTVPCLGNPLPEPGQIVVLGTQAVARGIGHGRQELVGFRPEPGVGDPGGGKAPAAVEAGQGRGGADGGAVRSGQLGRLARGGNAGSQEELKPLSQGWLRRGGRLPGPRRSGRDEPAGAGQEDGERTGPHQEEGPG